jgi:hypothetical protein
VSLDFEAGSRATPEPLGDGGDLASISWLAWVCRKRDIDPDLAPSRGEDVGRLRLSVVPPRKHKGTVAKLALPEHEAAFQLCHTMLVQHIEQDGRQLISRTPAQNFGPLKRSPVLVSSSLSRTRTIFPSRSTLRQRRARSSPRLMPCVVRPARAHRAGAPCSSVGQVLHLLRGEDSHLVGVNLRCPLDLDRNRCAWPMVRALNPLSPSGRPLPGLFLFGQCALFLGGGCFRFGVVLRLARWAGLGLFCLQTRHDAVHTCE